MLPRSLSLFLATLMLAAAGFAGGVQVGDEVRYDFREPPLNGLGLKSLRELRGTPVLIEFWGTH